MTESERIIRLETQMDNIEKKVDETKVSLEKKIDEVKDLMEDFISRSDDVFASKWVERVVWGGAAVVGGALILYGLSYILKTPITNLQ